MCKGRGPALALAAILLATLVLATSPGVGAQAARDTYGVAVSTTPAEATIGINGLRTFEVEITDRSLTGVEDAPGLPAVERQVRIDVQLESPSGEEIVGWSAGTSPSIINMDPGTTVTTELAVLTTTTARPNVVYVQINVTMEVRDVTVENSDTLTVRLEPYRRVAALVRDSPPVVGPNGFTFYPVYIENLGNYPDTFTVELVDTGTLDVGTTSSLGLQPGEVRPIELAIVGPRDVFIQGSTQLVTLRVMPAGNPDAAFQTSVPVTVRGWWVPEWTYPLWVLLVAAAVVGGQQTYKRVREDREHYGHPGPKPPTDAQEEKLAAVKERDPEKYEALVAALVADWKQEKEAYKERKKKGKGRHPRRIERKLRKRERKRARVRRRGIRRVKKGKKKGKEPRAILEDLKAEERDELKDDLPAMLGAPTAAGAALAAKPDDERTLLTDLRADLVADRHTRLRAEALALVRLRRQQGHGPDEVEAEMTTAHRQVLGGELEAAMNGEVDEDPEALLSGLNPLDRWKGGRFLEKLRKEKEKLRSKALKVIKKGKRKDWSRDEILSRLSDEQVSLVGGLLPMMLDTHYPEEAELLLLDPSSDLTKKEERRRRKLQKKLHKRRLKEMESAAKKIEKLEEKGLDRDAILDELTRAERWAVQDFLDILLKPLPEAMAGLEAYLDRHDLPDEKKEVMERHLELLKKKEVKFAKKGLKRVEKLKRKGRSAEEIAAEIPRIEREALHGALPHLLRPSLSAEIAGLEEFVETQDLAAEEREIWDDHLDDLRDEREKRAKKAVKRLKKLKKKDREPAEVLEAMDERAADALGRSFEPMVEAALKEDVELLWQLSRPDPSDRKLRKARKKASKAREKAKRKAEKKVQKAVKKGASPADAVAGLPYSLRTVLRSEGGEVPDEATDAGEAEPDEAGTAEVRGGVGSKLKSLLPGGEEPDDADEDRKARAKELLAQGRSPAEVARILREERGETGDADEPRQQGEPSDGGEDASDAASASDASDASKGGLGAKVQGLLPFGGGSKDAPDGPEQGDGAWKKDLARDLLQAGVPKGRVAKLVRRAEGEVEGLSGRKRKRALKAFVKEAAEEAEGVGGADADEGT